MTRFTFTDQVVIVSGASRGIGKAIATAFSESGAILACLATTEAGAERTAAEIRESGGRAKGFACDIGSTESVDALFAAVNSEFGTPSVLINNAGVTADTLVLRMSDADWAKVLDVNLTGAFRMIRAATTLMMKARYGRIVNISSIIGLHGGKGQANYAAAKAGLIGLTMSVAKEFGSRNITCNAVAPGFIETDMTHELPEAFREYVVKAAPAGRLGSAEDVAAAVLFLSSQEAGYITGQTVTVDGGLTM
jgi:3-oxoacyl-[acyl-carrier protein] reductase